MTFSNLVSAPNTALKSPSWISAALLLSSGTLLHPPSLIRTLSQLSKQDPNPTGAAFQVGLFTHSTTPNSNTALSIPSYLQFYLLSFYTETSKLDLWGTGLTLPRPQNFSQAHTHCVESSRILWGWILIAIASLFGIMLFTYEGNTERRKKKILKDNSTSLMLNWYP